MKKIGYRAESLQKDKNRNFEKKWNHKQTVQFLNFYFEKKIL